VPANITQMTQKAQPLLEWATRAF